MAHTDTFDRAREEQHLGFHRLTPDQFQLARGLFDTQNHLAVAAALAGEAPAELYVDDPLAPNAAFLIVLDRRIYLAGTPNDATFSQGFAALLHERHSAPGGDGNPAERTIAYTPNAWEDSLPTLFADIESHRVDRLTYRLQLDGPLTPLDAPEGFTLRPIDAHLAAESTLVNHQALLAEMLSERPSLEDFLQRAFGWCIQHDKELVAWCLSEYNQGSRCELGIETLSAFRRQGLALVTASATIAHAQAQGITTIGWHCWKSNIASRQLALTLGFDLVEEYPVWYCRFARQTGV